MHPKTVKKPVPKSTLYAFRGLALILVIGAVVIVMLKIQNDGLQNKVNQLTALNVSTTKNSINNPVGVLSMSDPLLITKLTTQCPQLPPELFELMLLGTPEDRARAQAVSDKLNDWELPEIGDLKRIGDPPPPWDLQGDERGEWSRMIGKPDEIEEWLRKRFERKAAEESNGAVQ